LLFFSALVSNCFFTAGRITLEYLRFWYKKAAAFYRAKPWEHCTEQCVFEVEVQGIGKRNVIISGSDGKRVHLKPHSLFVHFNPFPFSPFLLSVVFVDGWLAGALTYSLVHVALDTTQAGRLQSGCSTHTSQST
jgi:hypothetical protein